MLTETNTLKTATLILLLSIFSNFLLAQGPDCNVAQVICSDGSISFTPQGAGVDDFADPDNNSGCLQTNENQSAWYYFEINSNAPPGLDLGFIINPNGGFGEDYDFAIFGPNVDCGDLGSPIRCSYADATCIFCPETGLGNGAIDTSEDPSGDGFVAPLVVNPGEGYFLLVDNWLGSSSGFNMDWTGAAAPFLDCCALNVFAGEDQVFCQQGAPIVTTLEGQITNNGTGGGTPVIIWTGQFLDDPTIANPTISIPSDFSGTLNYTLEATDVTCSETSTMTITVTLPPDLEIQSGLSNCQTTGSLTAVATNGTAPYNYIWSNNATGPLLNGLSSGAYTVTVTDNNGCTNSFSTSLVVTPPFEVFVVSEVDVSCAGLSDGSTEITVSGGSIPFNYSWSNGMSGAELTNLSGGIYEVLVTDGQGCTGTASILIEEPLPLSPNIQSTNINCYGDQNGTISVTDVEGGTPPYLYAFDNSNFQETSTFINLSGGNYSIQVVDQNGCETESIVEIMEPAFPLKVDLGDLETICLGEAYELTTLLNYPVSSIASVEWTPAICDGCLDTILYLMEGMSFKVVVTDENGCTAEASKTINVSKKREIFIPNAFSPNNDGINDVLMVFGGREVEEITSFQIFNRWGETVFSANNFQPNDPLFSWDGFLKGKLLPNAVYPFFAKIKYIDGYEEVKKGDITLVK